MSDEKEPEETVELERLLPGPVERVWEHLTSPEHLEAWLESDEGAVTHRDPPRRLSYTREDQEVTFELEPAGDDVRLRVTHRRIAPALALALAA